MLTLETAKKKYQNVKPGLYFMGIDGNFDFKLIYILQSWFEDQPKTSITNGWKGVIYQYFDFAENRVYQFNEYWDSLIDGLRPVKNEEILNRAKDTIRRHYKGVAAVGREADEFLQSLHD